MISEKEQLVEIRKVILGIDGSDAAGAAARWAADAVRDADGEVIAVHGLGTLPELVLGLPPSRLQVWKQDLRQVLEQRWCRPLREAGVRYRAVLADADPVHAILDMARRENADLIVLGTEGKTGFFHRLLGSLSTQLLHHAWRPIVAVPFHPQAVDGDRRPR